MLARVGTGAELQTHTFLFTDVEGSTRRWEAEPEAMPALLAAHDQTLVVAVEAHRGTVFKHTGDGICAVFPSAAEAVSAAVEAQRNLELPVRMAVHSGEAIQRDGDYFGVALSRCARLMEAGHGGQVLLSASSAGVLGPEVEVRDLGEHRLRDLSEPERIFQVLTEQPPHEFPALRTLDAVRHNLPVLRSSFVGRELELIEVCQRLEAGPLVTLTGIGGCGKTRLALESAARLIDRFPQGVFFVDLAVLSDPELVSQAVASALGLHVVDSGVQNLASHLEGRRVLVVLDNCEHVVDACAELVDGLLGACRELQILATSRESLGVDGEHVFRVPSLSLESDAKRLFVDRARAAGATLGLDASDDDAVTEICRRLDGIPLAIELAAARTTHLSPAQIVERLSDRFRLLTGGRRRVQRQQTLSAAIDWSHDLLSPDEQMLLRRLAVFRGSFSLEEVEEICRRDAVDLLGSLVDKSLVTVQVDCAVSRYRLLETVRLYAEERLLASGEAAELRSAHRDWLLTWLESLPVGQLVEPGGGDQLVPEVDNLAAALDWSLDENRLDLIARMASRMIGYWWSYVRVADLGTWWRVLEEGLSALPDELRAAALIVGVQHGLTTGEFEQMQKLSAEVLQIAAPDSWIAAYAWSIQALYWTVPDPQRMRRSVEAGRNAAAAAGAPELESTVVMWSAGLLTGDPETDERSGGGEILEIVLARIENSWPAQTPIVLGIVAALGHTETASRLAARFTPRNTIQRYSHVLLEALIAIREGRLQAASEHLRDVAGIVREYAIPLGEASCVVGFSAIAANAGDYEAASRQLASVKAAGVFPFRSPADVLVYRQTARVLRKALDPATAARCRAEGAAIPVRKALDDQLAQTGPAGRAIETR
jgi:predicted ATPase/class 3 adenylate cyclase